MGRGAYHNSIVRRVALERFQNQKELLRKHRRNLARFCFPILAGLDHYKSKVQRWRDRFRGLKLTANSKIAKIQQEGSPAN
jgi:hypothetical protein